MKFVLNLFNLERESIGERTYHRERNFQLGGEGKRERREEREEKQVI